MSEYGKGALQSPADERDYDITTTPLYAAAAVTANPPDYHVTPVPPLFYQNGYAECFAFAMSRVVDNLQRHDPKVARWLRLDGHAFARIVKAHDGIPGEGSTGRATLHAARIWGVPVIGSGLRYHIGPYYAVPLRRDTVKTAIRAYGTLLFALPWPASWDDTGSDGILPRRSGPEEGHMFTLDGWDHQRGFLAVNQWQGKGRRWGENGRFWLPPSELENHGWESWKALDKPGV